MPQDLDNAPAGAWVPRFPQRESPRIRRRSAGAAQPRRSR